eukprot:700943-Pleurochrysis_carterae.AAC.2
MMTAVMGRLLFCFTLSIRRRSSADATRTASSSSGSKMVLSLSSGVPLGSCARCHAVQQGAKKKCEKVSVASCRSA